ncbi:metallophosphoesterase [Dysgonomonas sp. Marseille-P4677]|uniref:metallophosphoesterase n=1 Tax=Dysgonomonas sp. Marseille-P4677 TaxID=2364790 RepID=UPI0019131A95|nr:metallophosphoesterase [Dysgonomonas sp. Marseille-P4677]MBK5722691.1 metallophosphoesterase [Dysgonomonas sp. Marseille-P4677]
MAKLRTLHISDLHFGRASSNKPEDIAILILEAIETHNKENIDCVIITGDLFDGRPDKSIDKEQFTVDFLRKLEQELKLSSENFIIIPGNHDLKRVSKDPDFSEYKRVLERFYNQDYYKENFNDKYLFTTKVYPDKKVAIVGLNSCMVETSQLDDGEIKWINDLKTLDKNQKDEIITSFLKKKEEEWDDYGIISKEQLRNAFKKLAEKIENIEDYSIVACFHHHFYPFPEIYSKYGDSSIIRNFTDVIEKFQKENVKIVLHGHKHMPIIGPVTNHNYLSNPNSIFYVFSAGSLSHKDETQRSFEIIDIFSPDSDRISDVFRFNYKLDSLQGLETFRIPPKNDNTQHSIAELYNLFRVEYPEEFKLYWNDIYEKDDISSNNRIEDIIKNISSAISPFEELIKNLRDSPIGFQLILYSVHYRINYLNKQHNKGKNNFITILKNYLNVLFEDKDYLGHIYKLLEANRAKNFIIEYERLCADFSKYKKYTAYVTVTLFLVDLYSVFSKYGELYYKNERINANIKLNEETFHPNIPISTFRLESNIDRRSISIHFKCSDPTIHKIAVLIIKDFEKRITKIEDSFGVLGLKLYYVFPKVERNNYDLDNLNFEAYIPKLLPLLTGDNLYKRKEVFIRELIQNSLDAILLREDILRAKGQQLDDDLKIIKIEIGIDNNPVANKERTFIRIIDHGVGMDRFKVERYFTSIGRSFYKSEDFEELQKNENIEYKPISNFGIGFLSAFMVCKEIDVITKSYEYSEKGLKIQIPNYDGCFFINELPELKDVGTIITLYEDKQHYVWNIDNIVQYIEDTFIDFKLEIQIKNNLKGDQIKRILPFNIKRNLNVMNLFCPIEEDKVLPMPIDAVIQGNHINQCSYGVLLTINERNDGSSKGEIFYLNSGIALTESNDDTLDFELPNNVNLYCNLPASLIELDVARETIRRFKGNNISKRRIYECFLLQNNELVNQASNYTPKASLSIYNDLYRFLVLNLNKRTELYDDISRFHLKITRQKDKQFTLSIDNNEKGLGFVYSENNNLIDLILTIFESLSISPVLNESSIFYEFEDMIPYRQMINIIQDPWKNEEKRYDMRFFKEIFSTDKKLDLDLLRRLSYYFSRTYRARAYSKNSQTIREESSIVLLHLGQMVERLSRLYHGEKYDIVDIESENEYEYILKYITLAASFNIIEKYQQNSKDRDRPENIVISVKELHMIAYNILTLFYEILSDRMNVDEAQNFHINIRI